MFDAQVAKESPLLKLVESLGHSVEEWLSCCIEDLPETLRINTLRKDEDWTRNQIESMGGTAYSWFPDAYKMPWQRGSIPEQFRDLYIALHETGRITRQEAASMLPVLCLQPESNERVLDMCAAPGSKTTQIAERMNDSGVLVANDVSSSRLNTLVSNRSRVGLFNTVLCRHDGRHFPAVPDPGFDAILVDAPCTGSATVRKNRHVWKNWKEESGWSLRRLQEDILKRACSLLKPGGRLVYSTCSFDPVENEGVVSQILSELDFIEVQEIDVKNVLPGLKLRKGICNWKNEKINWEDKRLNHSLRLAPEDNDTKRNPRHPLFSISDWTSGSHLLPKGLKYLNWRTVGESMKPILGGKEARNSLYRLPISSIGYGILSVPSNAEQSNLAVGGNP